MRGMSGESANLPNIGDGARGLCNCCLQGLRDVERDRENAALEGARPSPTRPSLGFVERPPAGSFALSPSGANDREWR